MRRVLSGVVTTLFCFCFLSQAKAAEWKQVVARNANAVCQVQIYEAGTLSSSGSGFLIKSDGSILTNAHVVKAAYFSKACQIKVDFRFLKSPKQYPAEITMFSLDLDLCVLKIKGCTIPPCVLGDSDSAEVMDEVIVMGYPLGKDFKSTPGFLQSIQNNTEAGKMLDISIPVDPGNSGGPLFNQSGKVIGIVTGKYIGYNFNFAMPINVARNFIKNYHSQKPLSINSDPEGSRIYVNGAYKGVTPLTITYIQNNAVITAESDGYESQQITYHQDKTGGSLFVTLEKEDGNNHTITIRTDPPGANVTVDNEDKGKTPLSFDVFGGETLRIKIKKFGYDEIFQEVPIKGKKQLELDFKLK